jgi:DNA-binding LacI/PurR family transcriptional regulator
MAEQQGPAQAAGTAGASSPAVMFDVARRAGVSHMTVSRVINEPWRVRPSTRVRVQEAIDELGYRPNTAARSLITGRSQIIGVVAVDLTLFGPASILHGIEEAARDEGFFVSIASVPRLAADALRAAVQRLLNQAVDGVVMLAPFRAASQTLDAVVGPVPVVAVEGYDLDGPPKVAVDQRLGGRLAVEHLLSLGHRTVHHISGPLDSTESEGRAEGWRSALRAARRRVPALAVGDWSARSGYESMQALLRRGAVTAVFAANDHMALGALHALDDAGLRVPVDVSVVGFDDVPECAHYLPPLTTVRQDFTGMGRQAVRLLAQQIAGTPLDQRAVVLDPTLVVRSSTAPAHP